MGCGAVLGQGSGLSAWAIPLGARQFKLPGDTRTILALDPPRFLTLQTDDGGQNWAYRHAMRGGHIELGREAGAFAASNSSLIMPPRSSLSTVKSTFKTECGSGLAVRAERSSTSASICLCIHLSLASHGLDPIHVPLASGTEASGVFSLHFRKESDAHSAWKLEGTWYLHGIAVGGDYKKPNESNGTAAYTTDGGKTWTAATKPPHGYRSAVAWDAAHKRLDCRRHQRLRRLLRRRQNLAIRSTPATGTPSASPGSSAPKAASPNWYR